MSLFILQTVQKFGEAARDALRVFWERERESFVIVIRDYLSKKKRKRS